jgi:choline dehydrogenase
VTDGSDRNSVGRGSRMAVAPSNSPRTVRDPMLDYIVVGAGSAGCVTASRLVRDHGARVLLIEAGARDRNPLFRMPAGFIRFLKGSPHLTFHKTIPQSQLGGRTIEIPQAKVLGGGSSVNGLVYIRGQAADYDAWDEASGHFGWSFKDMLPHFRRMEGNQRLNNEMHGVSGPLKVSDHISRCELTDKFVCAVQGLGVPFNPDFNGGRQLGVGYLQLTAYRGQRCSAVEAFLRPVLDDPRLTIQLKSVAMKILFQGKRAVGVQYWQNGRVISAYADREVILTAGAFATPKLLMLSGIGPEAELRRYKIHVLVDLPGVGQNLQDHHEVPVMAEINGPFGYFRQDVGWNKVRNGLQYACFRSGPVTSNGVEACAFLNPDGADADASLQLYCVPTIYQDRGNKSVSPTDGLTLNSCLLRPRARGSVQLASNDPKDLPLVDVRFLVDEDDMRLSIAGLRYARKILKSSPLKQIVLRELLPGSDVESEPELREHCKRAIKTNYHPVGTCKMGKDSDTMAVLTPDLRVRGVEGLRVFDASMMPILVSGNTNAVVLAVADRAVGIMMEEHPITETIDANLVSA